MLTKANAIGYAVLALIFNQLTDNEVKELNVEPYLNGRESGFAVHFWTRNGIDRKFAFSRNRNSDDIVIYEGKIHDFSMQGNGLTEEIYRNKIILHTDDISRAADYIVDKLKNG
jgi:hypothetical protein